MLIGLSLSIPQIPRRPAGAPAWLPYTGAAIDLDFVAQKYWWGGAEKTTANFTTYVLNGSTFDATGLTPTLTVDISLSLSGLGTLLPGAFAGAGYHLGTPSTTTQFFILDNGTAAERVQMGHTTALSLAMSATSGATTQANMVIAGTAALGVRHGAAMSYATNDFKSSADGTNGTPDVAGTLPTVTTLRIGRQAVSASLLVGTVSRVVFFPAVKSQAELNALSIALRDNVVL